MFVTDTALAQIQARLAAGDAATAQSLATHLLATPSLPTHARLNAFALRSRARETLRDLAGAIADLESALTLDATQARLWNELGLLRVDSGDPQRAIDAFARATVADPRHARAFNNRGNALRSVGRIAEAVAAFASAVEADPGYALAWSNLGNLRREAGDEAGAEAALRRALTLDPGQRGAWLALLSRLDSRLCLRPSASRRASSSVRLCPSVMVRLLVRLIRAHSSQC